MENQENLARRMQEGLDETVAQFQESSLRNLEEHNNFDEAKWASLYAELNNNGTSNSKNLTDPLGDGDQSLIHIFRFAQFHRGKMYFLWVSGRIFIHAFMCVSMHAYIYI